MIRYFLCLRQLNNNKFAIAWELNIFLQITGGLVYNDEVVGISWVVSLKDIQGKGIGRSMVLYLFKETKNNEYDIVP